MKPFDFFLSYSRDIYDIATKIWETLDKNKINVWMDKYYVTAGSMITDTFDEILFNTQRSLGAIVIIDESYLIKDWCLKELYYFINHNIKIYPLSYKCENKKIFTAIPELCDCNIIPLEDLTDKFTKYQNIVFHLVLSILFTNPELLVFDSIRTKEANSILYEFGKNINNDNQTNFFYISVANSLANWIISLIYKHSCCIDFNRNNFLDSKIFPSDIRIILNHIDHTYWSFLNGEEQLSYEHLRNIKLSTFYIINWYLNKYQQ